MVVWAGNLSFGAHSQGELSCQSSVAWLPPSCLLELVYRDHTRASCPKLVGTWTHTSPLADTGIHALEPSRTDIQASLCITGYSSKETAGGIVPPQGDPNPGQDGTLLYSSSVFLFHWNQILEKDPLCQHLHLQ